jgi:hypothetical protein
MTQKHYVMFYTAERYFVTLGVIWEIILRDFWGAILRPLVTPLTVVRKRAQMEGLGK